jgi:hypothetical protein
MKEQLLQAIEAYGVAVKSGNVLLLQLSVNNINDFLSKVSIEESIEEAPVEEAATPPESGPAS